MPATGSDAGARLRVLFMGTPALAVPALAVLHREHDLVAVVTQPDRRAGRGRRVEPSPVKAYALELGVPILQPSTLRDANAVQVLAEATADVFVVVAYGLILPAAVLALPPLGCVNLHASLLPRHRGASPIQAAILAGDSVTGNTTMLMDEGLDTGPILRTSELAIAPTDTAASLGDRLGAAGADLVIETLRGLAAGTLAARPQPAEGVTMTGKIGKQDGRVDWRRPAAEIERLVRAMQPWPAAFTTAGEHPLRIWAAAVDGPTDAAAGTVVAAGTTLDVACGDGTILQLTELQRAGGRRLPAAELLRGLRLTVGTTLDGAGR